MEDFAVAIAPGYSPISSPHGAVINGGRWSTKDYTVDGTSGTAAVQGNSMQNGPSMEAVQKLKAQTRLDAHSNITGGGVMSFNLKSGTNLDANTWSNNNQGVSKGRARAWDYGASVGGPIHKNRTFYFGTFERDTQTASASEDSVRSCPRRTSSAAISARC